MYLAPLNYDRFFRKIFSDLDISKQFLEDFLDIEITDIKALPQKTAITDKAVYTEFDFRCRIDNQDVIIDMQQWYKHDVVHRFYMYHSLNTALQLENLPIKYLITNSEEKKVKEIKDYRRLNPVVTLIWMVDDSLGMKDNYASYTMLPEITRDFLNNHKLWANSELLTLIQARENILTQLNSRSRNLEFLGMNRLIFMYQHNIIKDENLTKYKRWFKFAEQTRNTENTEQDFVEYKKDPMFQQIIQRLMVNVLSEEDTKYIAEQSDFEEKTQRFKQGVFEDGKIEGIYEEQERSEILIKKAEKKAESERKKAEKERKRAEEEQKKAEEANRKLLETIKKLHSRNLPIEDIAEITGLSINDIQKIISL